MISLVCVDTRDDYIPAANALRWSALQANFLEGFFFCANHVPDYLLDGLGIRSERIPKLTGRVGEGSYSEFILTNLGKRPFKGSHILTVQWDGFIINPESWDNSWLRFDYMGAPFYNLGIGGFSLRSVRLCQAIASLGEKGTEFEEDMLICGGYRKRLESMGMVYADPVSSDRFCHGLERVSEKPFGFHKHNLDENVARATRIWGSL